MSGRGRGRSRKAASSSPTTHGNIDKQPRLEQGVESFTTGVKLTETQNQPTKEETKELTAKPNPNTDGELTKETTLQEDEPKRL